MASGLSLVRVQLEPSCCRHREQRTSISSESSVRTRQTPCTLRHALVWCSNNRRSRSFSTMFTMPPIKKTSGGRTGQWRCWRPVCQQPGSGGVSPPHWCLRLREWKIRNVFGLDRSKGKNAQIVSAGAATRQAPEHPLHDSGALWTIVGDVSHLAGIR
jgi:hypothetical protein